MHRLSFPALLLSFAALTACKKTEKVTVTSSSDDKPTQPIESTKAEPAKAEPAQKPAEPAAAGATQELTNDEPAFAIKVPADFVATQPIQTSGSSMEVRYSKEGEESGIGTFVSVTWWKKADKAAYAQLSSQVLDRVKIKADEKPIAGGKGTFRYGTNTASKMVDGNLTDATQHVGASAVQGKDFVLTCNVETFEEPPRPEFVRACETLTLR
jgi:hypothetical protein